MNTINGIMAMTMEIGMALNDLDIGHTVVVALGAITYTDKYQLINNGAFKTHKSRDRHLILHGDKSRIF